MNKKQSYDVVIVGCGASGLASAITCKRKNKNLKVVILEKNNKPGKKLLATGNGRCNLTNTNLLEENYHGSFPAEKIIEKVSCDRLLKFFSSLGLLCKKEKGGLVYPFCKQSSAVLDVLMLECNRLNIEIIYECPVHHIKKTNSAFYVKTDAVTFECKKLIMCCGGKASPSCGGTGAGLDLVKNLGHQIVSVFPALCPIETVSKSIKNLKGVRASCEVTLYDGENKIKSEIGELQFTENALSGICIFNLSSYIEKAKKPTVRISLMPDYTFNEICLRLFKRKAIFANNLIEDFLTGVFNRKISLYLLKECNIKDLKKKCHTLTAKEIERLAYLINNWYFECKKTYDFSKAQVMSGGVFGREINPVTMESKIIKNLFICGELIDINGDCGGYNLHFAFASGIIAGENI